jgi:hypothetical protein
MSSHSISSKGKNKKQRNSIKKAIKQQLQKKLRKFTERASILYTDQNKYFNFAAAKQ